jgi:hypothetical protein
MDETRIKLAIRGVSASTGGMNMSEMIETIKRLSPSTDLSKPMIRKDLNQLLGQIYQTKSKSPQSVDYLGTLDQFTLSKITAYLNPQSLRNLAQTSKSLHYVAKEELRRRPKLGDDLKLCRVEYDIESVGMGQARIIVHIICGNGDNAMVVQIRPSEYEWDYFSSLLEHFTGKKPESVSPIEDFPQQEEKIKYRRNFPKGFLPI